MSRKLKRHWRLKKQNSNYQIFISLNSWHKLLFCPRPPISGSSCRPHWFYTWEMTEPHWNICSLSLLRNLTWKPWNSLSHILLSFYYKCYFFLFVSSYGTNQFHIITLGDGTILQCEYTPQIPSWRLYAKCLLMTFLWTNMRKEHLKSSLRWFSLIKKKSPRALVYPSNIAFLQSWS